MLSVIKLGNILQRLMPDKFDRAFGSKDSQLLNGLINSHELGSLNYSLAGLEIRILADSEYLA